MFLFLLRVRIFCKIRLNLSLTGSIVCASCAGLLLTGFLARLVLLQLGIGRTLIVDRALLTIRSVVL